MISIIVPVYNVEPYLEQCLDSIIHQTYRDIEIIVVNDGSTDRSGEICRAYAGRDPRIVLFETENRGLSAARNLGIDNAHGEWIMFVDSDDWVEPEFCEAPLRAAQENDADLVIFGFAKSFPDGQQISTNYPAVGLVSPEQAVENGKHASWNKLYHVQLFESIRYPEGRVYEDVATTHRLIYRAKKTMMLNEHLYHYCVREGSISYHRDFKAEMDCYLSVLERYDDLIRYGYPEEKLETEFLICSLRYLEKCGFSDSPIYKRAASIVSDTNVDSRGLNAHQRNALKIWRLNRTLFHSYYKQ